MLVVEEDLLVVAEEDLDWQPGITADLESVGKRAELLHLLRVKLPAVKLKVLLDTGSGDTLWDDRSTTLEAPHEEDLSGGLALGLCNLCEGLVLCKGGVGGSEA